jgi:hypothetical protein
MDFRAGMKRSISDVSQTSHLDSTDLHSEIEALFRKHNYTNTEVKNAILQAADSNNTRGELDFYRCDLSTDEWGRLDGPLMEMVQLLGLKRDPPITKIYLPRDLVYVPNCIVKNFKNIEYLSIPYFKGEYIDVTDIVKNNGVLDVTACSDKDFLFELKEIRVNPGTRVDLGENLAPKILDVHSDDNEAVRLSCPYFEIDTDTATDSNPKISWNGKVKYRTSDDSDTEDKNSSDQNEEEMVSCQELSFSRLENGRIASIKEEVESIDQNIFVNIEKVRRYSLNIHLVSDTRLGLFFESQFLLMAEEKVDSKDFYVQSLNHSMSLCLYADDNEKKIKFYNPNYNAELVNIETDLNNVRKWNIAMLFPKKGDYSYCFSEKHEAIFTLYEFNGKVKLDSSKTRTLHINLSENSYQSPQVSGHFFNMYGFKEEFIEIGKKVMSCMTSKEQFDYLMACDAQKISYSQLQMAHGNEEAHEAMKTYLSMQELQLDPEEIVLLLSGNCCSKRDVKVSIISDAVKNGNENIIKQWGELVKIVKTKLGPEHIIKLLHVKGGYEAHFLHQDPSTVVMTGVVCYVKLLMDIFNGEVNLSSEDKLKLLGIPFPPKIFPSFFEALNAIDEELAKKYREWQSSAEQPHQEIH